MTQSGGDSAGITAAPGGRGIGGRREEARPLEAGSVTLFMAIVAPVFFIALAGLVFDGGSILTAKRQAINTAQQAARAGAQGLATEQAREGVGGPQNLDIDRAQAQAQAYLAQAGHSGTVEVTGEVVRVTVTIQRSGQILPFATTVIGSGESRNVRGVVTAET